VVCFNSANNLSNYLNKVNDLGGRLLSDKKLISEEIGYMDTFKDTEGNRLAFWSKR